MTNRRLQVEPLDPPLDPSKFATTKYTWQELKEIIANDRFPIYRHVDQETTYRLYSRQLKKEWKSVCDFVLHCKFDFGRRLIPTISNENNDSNNANVNPNHISDKNEVLLSDQKCDKKMVNVVDAQTEKPLQPSHDGGMVKNNSHALNLSTLPIIPPPPNGYKWESYSPTSTSEEIMQEPQRVLAMNDFPYYMEDNIEHWCLWKLGGGDVDDQDIRWAKEKLNTRDDILEMQHWINPVQYKSLPDIDHAHIICLTQ
eukprot:CAMPEP_0203670554 /NCGR_PEP_ID=MMETSP0090-20130426/6599_1 /ASSEMBLY_ACC=CAM_ASM_001088 /TAXON_ID=426623 /ORGANISM="Chaetoceros affinis, Strain CCMP159" /LENGTH=255 /DNA_ID=CAMNT_0050535439 /DNA_START=119 /DNA_END=886 /DNA_ORIENTATION=-